MMVFELLIFVISYFNNLDLYMMMLGIRDLGIWGVDTSMFGVSMFGNWD